MYNIMSGIQNNLVCHESSEEEGLLSSSFRQFDLENEEVLRFVFNEKQIFVEPEDHLSSLIMNMNQPSETIKKQEKSNPNDIFAFNSDPKNTLNEELELARFLMDKCRIIQQIILSTSKETIYDYQIGFDSQNQNSGEEDSVVIKEKIESDMKTQNHLTQIQLDDLQIQTPIKKYVSKKQNYQDHMTVETLSKIGESRKFALLLKISDFNIKTPFSLSEQLDLIRRCYQQPVSVEQKKKFLLLFEKLQSIRKGIIAKAAQIKGNEHACKVCNMQFSNGRMLGGHMSRKHPGNSFQYQIKKQIHITKECERNRRIYFKKQKTKKIIKTDLEEKLKCRK